MNSTQPRLLHRPTPLKLDHWSVVFFAAVHGVALLAPWFFNWPALGITIFLHWLFGSIGVCLGYHRLLSHRSFKGSSRDTCKIVQDGSETYTGQGIWNSAFKA